MVIKEQLVTMTLVRHSFAAFGFVAAITGAAHAQPQPEPAPSGQAAATATPKADDVPNPDPARTGERVVKSTPPRGAN
mgnify:CR=1 FL=1